MSSRCFTGPFVYLFFYVFSGNNPRYSWLIVFYKEHVSWAAMTLQNKYSVTPADTFWNAEYLVVQRRKFEFHAPFDVPQFFEQLSAKRNFQTRKSPEWNRKLKHIICFWLLFFNVSLRLSSRFKAPNESRANLNCCGAICFKTTPIK